MDEVVIENPLAPRPDRVSIQKFQSDPGESIERALVSGKPLVLTHRKRARAVVLRAEAYNALLEALDRAETIAGIRRGLEEMRRGEGIPLDEAFRQIREGLLHHESADPDAASS